VDAPPIASATAGTTVARRRLSSPCDASSDEASEVTLAARQETAVRRVTSARRGARWGAATDATFRLMHAMVEESNDEGRRVLCVVR